MLAYWKEVSDIFVFVRKKNKMKKMFLLICVFIASSVISKSDPLSLDVYYSGRFERAVSSDSKNGVLTNIRGAFLNFDQAKSLCMNHEMGSASVDGEFYTVNELIDICEFLEAKFNQLNQQIPFGERRFEAWGVDRGGSLGERMR